LSNRFEIVEIRDGDKSYSYVRDCTRLIVPVGSRLGKPRRPISQVYDTYAQAFAVQAWLNDREAGYPMPKQAAWWTP